MNPDCSTVRAWRLEQCRPAPWNPRGLDWRDGERRSPEGMVAQTRDDVSMMTGQWATRVAWSICVGHPCAQPYQLVSYLYYFTTSI
jgi:hypothetical protein